MLSLKNLSTLTGKHVSFLKYLNRATFCITSRYLSLNKPPNFIATPIFYVNSVPHIGHLYTTVYADAIFRFSKLVNQPNTNGHIFCTGTDEHGLKVQRSAEAVQQDTLQFCNQVSSKFRQLFESCDVSFTHFNRTTDPEHKKAVQALWKMLQENEFIYKSSYQGYYSVADESFVPENSIITKEDGSKVTAESGQPVEWHEEENYMFRLSSLQKDLAHWIDNSLILRPENFYAALKADIRGDLRDLSISRSKSRLKWGIEVPGDSSQVIYVWFDALINYLTPSGFPDSLGQWPPCHLIGKDILKFHAIYWPAFLMAAKIEPPNLIYCHSHWLYEEQKMSKSKGNVVDPNECIAKFTSDGIRFFLLKEGTPHSDSNFSMDKVRICLNADLANTYGNLLNRCTSSKLNRRQHFPFFDLEYVQKVLPESQEIIKVASTLASNCYSAYLNGNFYMGISQVMDFLRLVNGLLNETEPWSLVNSADKQDRLDTILYVSLEALRTSSVLLEPVIPRTSNLALNKLNIDPELRTWSSAENAFIDHPGRSVLLDKGKYVLFSKLY